MHIVSLAPSPGAEATIWKVPGFHLKEIHWLILGHVPEGQDSVWTFSGDWSTGRYLCHFLFNLLAGCILSTMLAPLAPPCPWCSPVDSPHSTCMPGLERLPSGLLLYSIGQVPFSQHCTYSQEACGSAISGRHSQLAEEPLLCIPALGPSPLTIKCLQQS